MDSNQKPVSFVKKAPPPPKPKPLKVYDHLYAQAKDTYRSIGYWKRMRAQRNAATKDKILAIINSLSTVPYGEYVKNTRTFTSEVAGVPSYASEIEINDSCNIDCIMCKPSLATRKKGLMDLGLFEELIAKLKHSGIETANLHTIGDPLANRNLAKYLEVLRKYKCHVPALSSNCLLMERHIDTIFEYRDVIDSFRPSIDGASKQVYEKIRAGGKWEKLFDALHLFNDRNRRAKFPYPVVVHSVISKDNYHELAYIPHVFSFVTEPTNFNFNCINSLAPTNDYFDQANYFEDYYINSPCSLLWNMLNVLKDGSLTTCCRDYDGDLVFANALEGSITENYNNEKVKAIRKTHLTDKIEDRPKLCQTCYTVDERLSNLFNAVFQYFFWHTKKHPSYLQQALNKIGPMLNKKSYDDVKKAVAEML